MKTYKNNVINSFGLKVNLIYKNCLVYNFFVLAKEKQQRLLFLFCWQIICNEFSEKLYLDNNNNNGDGKITRNS